VRSYISSDVQLQCGDFHVSEAEDVDDACGGSDIEGKQKPADGLSPHTAGNEDQIESEQPFDEEEDVKLIPDDFYYSYDEHVSKAAVSDESGLPPNLMML